MRANSIFHMVLWFCLTFLCMFSFHLSNAGDTVRAGEVMRHWESLESRNKKFQLGFFTTAFSSKHYLAIKFLDSFANKMVWMANRENGLDDTSGYLNITSEGYLVVGDESRTSITLNTGNTVSRLNTSLTLLDSGNLVLIASQQVLWQSFDHPTDTILPGMKIGLFDLKLKQPRKQLLTSWVSPGVPSNGAFTFGVVPDNTKQLEVRRRGIAYWRSGNWNERNLSNFTRYGNLSYFPFGTRQNPSIKFSYTSNENESYFTYSLTEYNYSWIELNSTGYIRIHARDIDSRYIGPVVDCGAQKKYNTEGCIEQNPSRCSSGDEFELVVGQMDMWIRTDDSSMGLSDCKEECRNLCNCTAYGSELPDGSGCKFSYANRSNDMTLYVPETFYIRNTTEQNDSWAAAPEEVQITAPTVSVPASVGIPKMNQGVIIFSSLASLGFLALALFCILCYIVRKQRHSKVKSGSRRTQVGHDTEQFMHELGTSIAAIDESTAHKIMLKGLKDHELPLFSFSSIESATEHFSEANKLGQGGFGPVFMGTLVDGQKIAVKRLSAGSRQGVEEFKNEVMLISKVQHKNLVRLLGCCIKGEEKLLVYEYLQNKSLDKFLFDETKRMLLDWRLRKNIIEGIAQGILYLHKYSRLKIIHRDLKTSNILLDKNMSPKISDFGTAKIFGDNESRANTNRIVGTYGYMSPEYAMDGLFSVKSDVFSFGVMMLEIVSGVKNTGFYQSDESLNLVRHAWNLWKEERSLELMDPLLAETCSANEVERCVQIALVCVQENAEDRPTMSNVVSMLSSDTSDLQEPQQSSHSTIPRENYGDLPESVRIFSDITVLSPRA